MKMGEEVKSPLDETPIEKGERVLGEVNKDYGAWMKHKQWGFADRMIRNLIITMTEVLIHMGELERKEEKL